MRRPPERLELPIPDDDALRRKDRWCTTRVCLFRHGGAATAVSLP